MKGIKLTLATLAMTMASSAFAAITFDFSERISRSSDNSLTFESTDGNYSLEASGWSIKPDYSVIQTNIASSYYGLFIENGPNDSSHEIDGYGYKDYALLNFLGNAVKIISATFSYVDRDGSDDFNLLVDGVQTLDDIPLAGDFYSTSYDFSPQFTGTTFGFLADWKDDDFKLRSVTVEYVSVPEPASITLLGLGLIALVFIRRRKAQS
ncbi:PEP-CTERM sorting domain-containing protein [Porticoccus sp. GXU_MW_L64]